MSPAVKARSKSASHLVTTVPVAEVSTGRSVVVSVIEALQVVAIGGFGGQPECVKYLTCQTPRSGELLQGTFGVWLPHNTGCCARGWRVPPCFRRSARAVYRGGGWFESGAVRF